MLSPVSLAYGFIRNALMIENQSLRHKRGQGLISCAPVALSNVHADGSAIRSTHIQVCWTCLTILQRMFLDGIN